MSAIEKIEENIKRMSEDLKSKRIYLLDVENQIQSLLKNKDEARDTILALSAAIQVLNGALSVVKEENKEPHE
jgi:chromosome segregation ATPase